RASTSTLLAPTIAPSTTHRADAAAPTTAAAAPPTTSSTSPATTTTLSTVQATQHVGQVGGLSVLDRIDVHSAATAFFRRDVENLDPPLHLGERFGAEPYHHN